MKVINAFILFLLVSGVGSCTPYQSGSFDPVRMDPATWTCYDTAINYARVNPDWGIVYVSRNPNFYGISHMVNYQIKDGVLWLHDDKLNLTQGFPDEYLARTQNEQFYPAYYCFWQTNETPLRNYRILKDNYQAATA